MPNSNPFNAPRRTGKALKIETPDQPKIDAAKRQFSPTFGGATLNMSEPIQLNKINESSKQIQPDDSLKTKISEPTKMEDSVTNLN